MKPNVLQLVGSFYQGGSERQAIQLTELLRSSDQYDVHLACLSPAGSLRERAEKLGFKEIPAFPLTSFYDFNAITQLRRLVSYLHSNSIDIVQSHDFYTNVFGMIGGAIAGTKVRIAARRETSGLRTVSQQKAEKLAYRLAHAIVANADAVRRKLIQEGVSDKKIVTIYNGLDLEQIVPLVDLSREELLERLGLPTGDVHRFVTIVANLRHPVKDHSTFLHAARLVLNQIPNSRFVIAGEGELLGPMQELARTLGLFESTLFIGRCDRVNELLNVSDVCVLSSVAEGFSNAILEYMGAARPVVATDVGGAKEAVREGVTGFLVAGQDPEAMANRIIELLSDAKLANKMGESGRRVVVERFSCEAQVRETENLYERLLARGKGKPARVTNNLHSESLGS